MVCCILLAALAGLLLWPLRRCIKPRRSALEWRVGDETSGRSIPSTRFSVSARIRSITYAWNGVAHAIRTQHNTWIHIAATLGVLIAGMSLNLTVNDWRWLALAIAWVWFAEIANTALEHLCDVVSPERNPSVKHAKDIAAGAVMVSALAAVAIGALTFAPYLSRSIDLF